MKSLVFTKYFSSTASKEEETWNNIRKTVNIVTVVTLEDTSEIVLVCW